MHFELFLQTTKVLTNIPTKYGAEIKWMMSVHLVPNKMGLTGMKGMFQNRIVSSI